MGQLEADREDEQGGEFGQSEVRQQEVDLPHDCGELASSSGSSSSSASR